jgi:mono/diheme cytochrome c family protein
MDAGKVTRRIGSTLLAAMAAAALAQTPAADSRGELLYATHCQGCHAAQVHWRERRLATDWPGLVAQVARWRKNANLDWGDEDVDAVARWLNARYYRFAAPEAKPVGAIRPPPRG